VATPVWFVQEGGRLLVRTGEASGKAKRIRRNPAVQVAPCTARGRLRGQQVSGVARVLPGPAAGAAERLITRKYRSVLMIIRPLWFVQSALHLGRPHSTPAILAITPRLRIIRTSGPESGTGCEPASGVPMTVTERSDAARNRQAVLAAAGRIFASAADPGAVTMDDIAAEAGVGKGTLFRRFGDRAGLIRAVFDARIADLIEAITSGPAPLGPSAPPRERVIAALDAVVAFKLENRQLTAALERPERQQGSGTLFQTPQYATAYALLSEVLRDLVGPGQRSMIAHALLSVTRIDLIEHLLVDEGWPEARIREETRNYVELVLGAVARPAADDSGAAAARAGRRPPAARDDDW
jgi:PPOX class probable F420-dependent enzyme